MRLSIEKISIIVFLLIVIIFCYQVYWLYGLYNSTYRNIDNVIKEAMYMADHEELFMRMTEFGANEMGEADIYTFNYNMTFDEDDSIGNEPYFRDSINNQIFKNNDTISKLNGLEKIFFNKEVLNRQIHRGFHTSIDSVYPVNLIVFDSIFSAKLKEQNVYLEHKLVLLHNNTQRKDSIDECLKNIEKNYSKQYDYYYTLGNNDIIRLYTKNPAAETLKQMIGILSTSVIILFLLLYIFSYMIRIIRKLQTEEELKRNFTNNMTHELKTPIAVSYAAVDALLISDGPVPLERQHKYLNIAKNQMTQLSGLVEQILSMSRKDNRQIDLKKEDVNIEDVISEINEKQQLVHQKEIVIDMDLEIKTIHADKLHLTNIFNNLIENSIKYSGDSVRINIQSKKENNHIILKLNDNGIGIDPKYMPKLFDKFYRVPTGNKHTVKGYGLGLFYVKEMILNHGGTINVQSKEGKGTEFIIKMPQ